MSDHVTLPLRGPLPILTAAVLWGSTGTASSLAPGGAPAAAVGAAGLALGGLLLVLSGLGVRPSFSGPEWRSLTVGAVAVAGYPLTFYPAVARTGVAVATVVALCSAPVFAGLIAGMRDRSLPSTHWLCATTAAVLGCAVLVLGPRFTGAQGGVDGLGVALAVLAGLTYVLYSRIGGELIGRGHPSGAVMGVLFGVAGLLVLPVLLAADTAWLGTVRGAAVAVHLAFFTTFLAYRLFGYGLRHTPVEVATTLTLAEPAVAAVLGVVIVGERLPLVSWCGLAVLGAGLALLTLAPARPSRAV
ncbi:DMT family transporter [Nocardia xishanensis]|uniref:DMT family transporter n=1 Tax=Nocardia xishanensis TaxID=238964 RepID=UPI000830AE73|nr:EamA family transporter [Nocardia xishanensis]